MKIKISFAVALLLQNTLALSIKDDGAPKAVPTNPNVTVAAPTAAPAAAPASFA